MTALQKVAPTRPEEIIARPVRIDPAFDDPDAVMDLIKAKSPYSLIYSAEGYARAGGAEPWFRGHWVKGDEWRVPEAKPFFYNPHFIEGAKKSFNAKVITPHSMLLNINAPMQTGRPHFDTCRFRGATEANYPLWLIVAMHHSFLFTKWSVPVATALSWFYRGKGGGFECWPDGPENPSEMHETPLWNAAVVSDNEYMFHRMTAIGRPEDRYLPGQMSGHELLSWSQEGYWDMTENGERKKRFNPDDIRVSIVWKAFAFEDENAKAVFDEHSDDLTQDMIFDIFEQDLKARGITSSRPADQLNDKSLRDLLLATYPPPGKRFFEDARR